MTTVSVDPETGEILDIDGDFPEDNRALVVRQPEAVGLARAAAPGDLIDLASKMATALRDIVERQHLYAIISGKKYPTVEAWSTIARMDNVVAREAAAPVRHDDGSYEATVELMRLSDLAVIGRGSALCGAPDDKPWNGRPEYARRSMAATRATSRAFRQHYSWIMALAGYEPTPADEMPHHEPTTEPARSSSRAEAPAAPAPRDNGAGAATIHGKPGLGKAPVDGELRETPDGPCWGFALLESTGKRIQVIAFDRLADDLAIRRDELLGAASVEASGRLVMIPWEKDGKAMPPYRQLVAERVSFAGEHYPTEDELAAIAERLP